MNISFIALNISGAETVQSAADKIRSSFSEVGRCDFRLCGSMAQVSTALSDAFANSDIVAVGAEPSVYSKAKLAILRAMHIKTQLDSRVRERIGDMADLDSQQLSLHCAMPENASVFLSDDGLYSGFAIRSGRQHFIMLPLDKLRVEEQLSKGVLAYFAQAGIEVGQKSEQKEAADVKAKPSCAEKAVELLKDKNIKVYFAATPSCEMVKDMCGEDVIKDSFVFTEHTAERGAEAPRSYIADLARYSIPDDEEALGAAVSNVYTGNSQATGERKYNIYVALADKNASRVLRFASQPGETPDELISAAIELLMDMICEKCNSIGAPVAESEQDKPFTAEPVEEFEFPTVQETQKKKKRGLRTVLYVLLAILLAFVGYFAFSGYENAEKNKEAAVSSFASYYSQGAAAESGSLLVFPDDYTFVTDEETSVSEDSTTDVSEYESDATQEATTVLGVLPPLEESEDTTTQKVTEKVTAKPTTTVKPTTTAKPTTTKKPTPTTKPITTVKPVTTAKPVDNSKAGGEFVFVVYGYGHGVGMSQEGALGYSKQGSSYTNILLHYYPGTTLVKDDPDMPETIKFGGKDYPIIEYLCRSVVGEIGSGCNSTTAEAFKAQTVALYTYAKRYKFNLSASMHAFNTSYKYEGSAAETAVKSVLGEYLSYNGQPIMATFFAMSAGKTVKASTVWSGNKYPYLEKSVDSPLDKNCARYKTTYTVSAEDFKALMKANLGVELSGHPSTWVKIEKHDGAVNSSVGYVERMTVGGKAITGAYFREKALQYKIRSHCFSVMYMEGQK